MSRNIWAVPRQPLRACRGRLFRSSAFASAASLTPFASQTPFSPVAALRRCYIAYRNKFPNLLDYKSHKYYNKTNYDDVDFRPGFCSLWRGLHGETLWNAIA